MNLTCAKRILRLMSWLALATCSGAWAQFLSGGVYGSIVGPDGKPLNAATVTLQGPTRTHPEVTQPDGQFRFLGLSPGNYQLHAEAAGFDPASYPSVAVNPGRSTAVQVRLSPNPTETITVTAEPPQFDPTRFAPVLTVNRVEMDTIPTPRDPWSLALLMPGVLASEVNAGGSASGQQPLLVAPGADSEQNAFVFDGVAITDLAATGASPTYFDIDQFDQVRVATASSDASQATSGVTIDMVTRHASNDWRGSLRGFSTGNSTGAARRGDGAPSNAVRSLNEAGGEAGGELWRDRGWIWGAASTSHILRQAFGGAPVDIRLNNETAKLNLQFGAADSGVALFNRSGKVWDGRGAGPTRARETLVRQDGDVDLYKIEDTLLVGSAWSLTGFMSSFDGSYSSVPFAGRDGEPVFEPDGVWHGGWFATTSSRNGRQWRLLGSGLHTGASGDQDVSFGLGERLFSEDAAMRAGRRNLYFQAGALFGEARDFASAMRYGTIGTRLNLGEAWLQDSWRLRHTTLSFGGRLDEQSGRVPATHLEANPAFPDLLPAVDIAGFGPQFRWRSLSPRLAVAHEVGRDSDTVLGASYARFASQLGSAMVSRGNTAYAYAYVLFEDRNGDHVYQPGEPFTPAGFNYGGGDRVDPGLRPQMTDALAFNVERRLGRDWRVRLDLTERRVGGVFESRLLVAGADGVTRSAVREDYRLDGTVTGTLPNGRAFSQPLYTLAPDLKAIGHELVNGDRSQIYRGATLSLDRPYRDGWMVRASATLGDWRWHIGPRFRRYDDPTDAAAGTLGDGLDPTDTEGDVVAQQADMSDRRDTFLNSGWSFGATGMAEVARSRPWSFLIAANVTGRQGYPIPYAVRVFGADGMARWVQASRRGDEFRTSDLYVADLRLEKDFRRGGWTLAASLEAFNLFDTRVVLQRSRQLNATTPPILETMSPRVLRAGLRVSFR